jgi:hypothetical protein
MRLELSLMFCVGPNTQPQNVVLLRDSTFFSAHYVHIILEIKISLFVRLRFGSARLGQSGFPEPSLARLELARLRSEH